MFTSKGSYYETINEHLKIQQSDVNQLNLIYLKVEVIFTIDRMGRLVRRGLFSVNGYAIKQLLYVYTRVWAVIEP